MPTGAPRRGLIDGWRKAKLGGDGFRRMDAAVNIGSCSSSRPLHDREGRKSGGMDAYRVACLPASENSALRAFVL